MNIKEIKQLLKISGGKLILSDGNLDESFVVLKLNDYLKEQEEEEDFFDFQLEKIIKEEKTESRERKNLTDEELLDKINADIEELRNRKQEEEIAGVLEDDVFEGINQGGEELNYEKI